LLYNGTTRTAALSFAAALALGRHHRRRDVEIRRVREVRIEGPPDVALQVDGDVLLATPPITVALAPHRAERARCTPLSS
jgi:diacylglycerol kinase family enzyme